MLIWKILDGAGSAETGEDADPFNYFSAPIPTSGTYAVTPRYEDVSRRWSDDLTGLIAVKPQETHYVHTSASGMGGFVHPADGQLHANNERDPPPAGWSTVEGPDSAGYYRLKRNSDIGHFRRVVGQDSSGGFRWKVLDSVTKVFGGTTYASRAYNELLQACGIAGWAEIPVIALATTDITTSYGEELLGTSYRNCETLEVTWHSRLDATAEGLVAAMVADRNAAIAAHNTYVASPTPANHAALQAAVVAFQGVRDADGYYTGGSASDFADRCCVAARANV